MTARRSTLARLLRRLLLLCLLVAAGVLAWQAATWPNVTELARRPPVTTAFIERYNERERAAGRKGRGAIAWVPYASISPYAKRAVLVAEDINFFSHRGFDWGEIGNAIEERMGERGRSRGASTISQQLVKNLWLSPGQNPLRKAKEALLTWQLERTLPKRRILELYLNVAEFGPGIYGVGPAAQAYFGKPAADLDETEAAQLAAALPRPRSWHPGSRSPAYQRYAAAIRNRMDKAEFLKKEI
ncbi:MAG TPA: monofunctional biosynthetic peptidoglycan transglycosylase [Candidatus Bathyarchaeia archaeon]|nr:monofunctional biosynthetic peptidoglycan transglycosylase [Candidatus Bathyarchaeia archaeon]